MAEPEVNVDVEVNADEPTGDSGSDVAEAKLIDGAVDAGKSAGEAELHQHQAEQHAQAAATAAAISAEAADASQSGADRGEQILHELQNLTRQNAEILAANAALHSQDHASQAEEIITEDGGPEVEIAPEKEHWLSKKWSFGGKKDKGE